MNTKENRKNWKKNISTTAVILFAAAALLACITAAGLYESLELRHERAALKWAQREPAHYRYTIHIQSSFWTNQFQLEILRNKIIHTTDLRTGQPAEIWNMAPGSYLHETSLIWTYILIDSLFPYIEASRNPPKTLTAFIDRANPSLYLTLSSKGILPMGRTSCDPDFPNVRYDPDYGYPVDLVLGGNPCTSVIELTMPMHIQITSFERLP